MPHMQEMHAGHATSVQPSVCIHLHTRQGLEPGAAAAMLKAAC